MEATIDVLPKVKANESADPFDRLQIARWCMERYSGSA